jgi:GntR family transcriptional repressor for pyruvate dehydrogenase complex
MKLTGDSLTVSRVNLYEQIADKLEELILASGFEEEKLPSEQALAEQFGVSRNVIREALKLLKERGLIDSRNGTGSYITKPEAANLSDVISRMVAMNNIDYRSVYDVRIILETAACKSAASRVTDAQLEEMEQLLEALKDRSLSVEERRETDFAFHVAIARAAGNPLLEILVRAMKNVFIELMEKGIFLNGGIDDAIMRHANILDALREHDPGMAEDAMYDHLLFSKKNVEKYLKDNQQVSPHETR